MKTITFNLDGTVDPEQLEGMPQEFIERVTTPEFQAQARKEIRRQMLPRTGRREMRAEQINRSRLIPSRFGPLQKKPV